jgi:hypothetical protein
MDGRDRAGRPVAAYSNWLAAFIVSAEAKMSDRRREIYLSENGDKWFLCRDEDEDGRVFVLHKANVSSGGTATKIELGDFLGRGKAGPEHQALSRLIGRLVDEDWPGEAASKTGFNGIAASHSKRAFSFCGLSAAIYGPLAALSRPGRAIGPIRVADQQG